MRVDIGVGIIGSGFVADIHAESFQRYVRNGVVQAVASPSPGNAARLAARHGIRDAYLDYRALLDRNDIQLVVIAAPNDLHCKMACDAAAAGKHVVCEKPLCRTLAEADRMIAACREAGVLLMYAEELLFAPKYVRARELAEEGALGRLFLVKQWEEHNGPHMPWFWDIERSGGGVLLDMGCHSIEFARCAFGKPPIQSVSAVMGTYVHGAKTRGEDHSIVIVEYEGGRVGMAENSWAKPGGVDDRAELYGSHGNTRADLLRGNALTTYSEVGYGYAVEKAGSTRGWTFTMFDEILNYGFPAELQHFVNCALGIEKPIETGEDGRTVLEIILAAYQSAGEGRAISWPYDAPEVEKPIDLWLNGTAHRAAQSASA
ncbi:MAG: Gfo/Idh/MocA family oxidoreductase [Armatimonadetes bacterium]|nr:Gfo/Idh/MocA family oxidoreductase [Armatimonadota bacterium]MDE2207821.1 Gfo/Idh/MocA family oxidoreductase [Armatimonadota bacterium]